MESLVRKATRDQVVRVMNRLKKDEKLEEGISFVRRNTELVKHLAEADSMAASLYDAWARTYWKKDWDKAISTYEKGLKELPNDRVLKGNLKYSQGQKKK